MKVLLLRISVFSLLFFLLGAGCKKDEIQYADENTQVSSLPGFCIYKTRNNYINNIGVRVDALGNVGSYPDYSYSSNAVIVDKGHVSLRDRYLLKSGYVLDLAIYVDAVFTDITIKEMCDKQQEFGSNYWNGLIFQSRIVDNKPFTEFYYYTGLNKPEKTFTLGEINKMIELGTLETVFDKLK